MRRKSIRAFSMMLLMMTAGCLQAVDGVIEDIDRTIDALEGDYPKLDLPEELDLLPLSDLRCMRDTSGGSKDGSVRRDDSKSGPTKLLALGHRANYDEDGWRIYLRGTRIGSC